MHVEGYKTNVGKVVEEPALILDTSLTNLDDLVECFKEANTINFSKYPFNWI